MAKYTVWLRPSGGFTYMTSREVEAEDFRVGEDENLYFYGKGIVHIPIYNGPNLPGANIARETEVVISVFRDWSHVEKQKE